MKNIEYSIKSNPVAVLFLGACPALAASASVKAAVAIGCSAAVVLILSSLVLALLKKLIGDEIKLPMAVVVTAFFVSGAQMVMAAWLPKAAAMVGVYLALFAINMMAMKAEGEAMEKKTGEALLDVVLTASAFLILVVVMGVLREVLGAGTFLGSSVPFFASHTIPVIAKAPGAFMVYSILLAVASLFKKEAK